MQSNIFIKKIVLLSILSAIIMPTYSQSDKTSYRWKRTDSGVMYISHDGSQWIKLKPKEDLKIIPSPNMNFFDIPPDDIRYYKENGKNFEEQAKVDLESKPTLNFDYLCKAYCDIYNLGAFLGAHDVIYQTYIHYDSGDPDVLLGVACPCILGN